MKMRHKLSVLPTGFFLLFVSLNAQASFYDIVCVECSLIDASYTLEDGSGNVTGDALVFPNAYDDVDFELFSSTATSYNSSFYFNPGIYTFDSQGDSITAAQTISMTVNSGQVGMHFLFDWDGNTAIDVLGVFDVQNVNGDLIYTPTDVEGNGIVGFTMVDGPFQGVDIVLNFTVATPVPAAFWLFASGLVGLLHIGRRKKI